MLCPECGKILTRYRVGHGVDFFIDRCAAAAAIWLDANEWQSLEHLHLADGVIHLVFSTAWQAENLREQQKHAADQLLIDRMGQERFEALTGTIAWIKSHPHCREIRLSAGSSVIGEIVNTQINGFPAPSADLGSSTSTRSSNRHRAWSRGVFPGRVDCEWPSPAIGQADVDAVGGGGSEVEVDEEILGTRVGWISNFIHFMSPRAQRRSKALSNSRWGSSFRRKA